MYAVWHMELLEAARTEPLGVRVPEGMTIRDAGAEDVPAIARIWPESFMPSGLRHADAASVITKHMNEAMGCYVLEDSGRVVSVLFIKDAYAWNREPAIEIAKCATDDACRGQGLIGYLIRHAVSAAGEGCRVFAQVMKGNHASVRSFAKAGFRSAGVLESRYLLGLTRYRIVP
ncbi:GNAT family N-acetyltransferase [Desulfovibrio psychrotolerans]|nr:GNAT family N-acetyltransferase [Desulfovibrio psychrotolerans]